MELSYPRIPGEAYPNSNLSPSSSSMVATGGERHPGAALTTLYNTLFRSLPMPRQKAGALT